MSIERALIKFKGDVRAAAEYILAGAPLKPPEYVFEDGLFYRLLVTNDGYEAMANGSDSIQDRATFILKEDLRALNDHYLFHVQFEEDSDTDGKIKELIHTYLDPAEASVNVPPLREVKDTNNEVVNFLEFEPYDISSGEKDLFLFTYKVKRFDGEKIITEEKRVFMSLDTAQLYLEKAAIKLRNWLLHGLLARLILQTENTFSVDQFGQLLAFEDNKYSLDFADNPKFWNGRFFVNGQQFSFQNKQLYTGKGDDIYTLLRQQATEDNPRPEYLLFRMAENSVDDLFKDSEQQERRIELNSILDGIVAKEGLRSGRLTTLKSFIGPEAYKVLNPEELQPRNYVTFGNQPKRWSGEYFVDGEQFTFTDEILYFPNKKEYSVYQSLKERATIDIPFPQYLLFQMVENSVDDLFKDIKNNAEQQRRRIELNLILERIIKEEELALSLERFISRKAYKVLTQL